MAQRNPKSRETSSKTTTTTITTTTTTTAAPGCSDCKFTVLTYYNGGSPSSEIVGTNIDCATLCAGTFGDSVNLVGTDSPFGNVDFTVHANGYTCHIDIATPSGTCVTSYGDLTSLDGRFSIGKYGSVTPCSSPNGGFYCCCQEN
ncbi:hypothetical protein I4U23_031463 [Adineta vaga]|nr:hypothetical protein I4U23_031463 [Adineta vaga]